MPSQYTEFAIVEGDLLPVLEAQLTNLNGIPVDISLATSIRFKMVNFYTGAVKINLASAESAQIPANSDSVGCVLYRWSGTDTDTPSLYRGWFVVTIGGKDQHFPNDNDLLIQINEAY